MQKGQFKQDDEELASDEGNIISNEPAIETEPEEPEA